MTKEKKKKKKPANAARREDCTFEVCAAEFERRLRAEAAAQGLEAAVFRTVDGDDQLIEAARPGRRLAIRLGAGTGSCWALAGSPDGARFGDLDTLDIADALRALGR